MMLISHDCHHWQPGAAVRIGRSTLWWEKIGLSNLRRPGRYPPPLNATTIQPLWTGSIDTPRFRGPCPDLRWAWLESEIICLGNIGVGKASDDTDEAWRGGCSSTCSSVGILLDPKFELTSR